jgi:hypothetical protein
LSIVSGVDASNGDANGFGHRSAKNASNDFTRAKRVDTSTTPFAANFRKD